MREKFERNYIKETFQKELLSDVDSIVFLIDELIGLDIIQLKVYIQRELTELRYKIKRYNEKTKYKVV